jgi:hypothetical protein
MKHEFYDIAFRKKLYHSLEELQADADQWIAEYNSLRPHSGRFCYGKTPLQTLKDSIHLAQSKDLEKQYGGQVPLTRAPEEASSRSEVVSEGATAPQNNTSSEHESLLPRKKELESGEEIADNLTV